MWQTKQSTRSPPTACLPSRTTLGVSWRSKAGDKTTLTTHSESWSNSIKVYTSMSSSSIFYSVQYLTPRHYPNPPMANPKDLTSLNVAAENTCHWQAWVQVSVMAAITSQQQKPCKGHSNKHCTHNSPSRLFWPKALPQPRAAVPDLFSSPWRRSHPHTDSNLSILSNNGRKTMDNHHDLLPEGTRSR